MGVQNTLREELKKTINYFKDPSKKKKL